MRITADTNLLLRALVEDDAGQAPVAQRLLDRATLVAVPLPVFCELVWVLRRVYKRGTQDIAETIETIVRTNAVTTDLPAVEVGLRVLRAGGDFADGVIAHQGAGLGGTVFASFDRRAVTLLRAAGAKSGDPAELLASA